MDRIKLFTIGFAKKSAEEFFTALIRNGVRRISDIRLHNTSQLAGFAKKDDLRYFLSAIGGIDYEHVLSLAPTEEILTDFKKNKGDWSTYERDFLALMVSREVEKLWDPVMLNESCLLCSEEKPRHCHRRLVAEYLRSKWGNVEIRHIE